MGLKTGVISGKWLLAIIFGVAFAMTGILMWIHSNRDYYRGQALAGIQQLFEQRKSELTEFPELLNALPDLTQPSSQPWKFEFIGDELWVEPPYPRPNLPADSAEQVETILTSWFKSWLHKQASDEKRFPIRIRWQQSTEEASKSN